MKRFVSIWLPHLLSDWFELRRPELKKVPFVLVKPDHGRLIITHGNALAAKKGIHAGMVMADAKAIFPDLQKFDEPHQLEFKLLKRIAEWCIRFTPIAAVDPLGGILLDASGCSHLWNGDENYINDILAKLKSKGFCAKATIADTVGCAWAVARFGNAMVVETGKQTEAISNLPPQSLRLDGETNENLHKLGLKRVADFFSMPRVALRRRFGQFILNRLDQATGAEEEFIEPVIPPAPFEERLPCLEPITQIEGITIALEQLLQQVCTRLQNEGKGLRTAHFKGFRTDHKMVGIQIETSRPSANPRHLFHLFEMKLSTIEPALGIELFLLEATKVEEHNPTQAEIWKKSGINDQQVAELIDRLSLRIGKDAIRHYMPDEHYWPERSFKKSNSFSEQTNAEWKLDRPRPLRLLSPPELIEVTAPVPDYPPMLFKYKGKLHKIMKADGPERIEQEWWIQQGEHRDYYAVEDEEGCRYWLFRSGHYNEEIKPHWFIHGFFA